MHMRVTAIQTTTGKVLEAHVEARSLWDASARAHAEWRASGQIGNLNPDGSGRTSNVVVYPDNPAAFAHPSARLRPSANA